MSHPTIHPSSCTAFVGSQQLASGPPSHVAVALWRLQQADNAAMPLVFDDATGRQVEFDLRGSEEEIVARYAETSSPQAPAAPDVRGRGRPRLGVVAREVTLLPEHWEWLAAQPGGASVALRKLVHEARRAGSGRHRARQAHERAWHVMSALAGNLPGVEEAGRALFANDRERLADLIAPWPEDVRGYVLRLADPDEGTP